MAKSFHRAFFLIAIMLAGIAFAAAQTPKIKLGFAKCAHCLPMSLTPGLAKGVDEVGHLVAEQGDQDVVLGLEVEIDGSRGDPGLARNVGHARVVVALAGEDPHGGVEDQPALLLLCD